MNKIKSQFSSVTQSRLTFYDPMDCSTPGLPVHHQLPEFIQTHVHWVVPSNHFILCCPLLLLPSIFLSIRVFSSESLLHIRWPKYRSFSFNISPSSEHSGLISFRMDWLNLLAIQGTLKSHVRPETIKLLEDNIGKTLCDINHSRILYDPPPRILEIKAKINKWDLIKIKSFCTTKEL